MNHLLRSLAPISDSAWNELDDEARQRLAPALAARKLVDFSGPHGWEYSATNIGRAVALKSAPCDGVTGAQRRVLPLVEVRAKFELAMSELQRHRPRRRRRRPRGARQRRTPDRRSREQGRLPWLEGS